MQPNNRWVDPVVLERQKRDVGIVEVLIREKIVPITISMIQWRSFRDTRVDSRIEVTANKTEALDKEVLRGGITGKKGKKGGSTKRGGTGQGMRGILGDQMDEMGKGIGKDIEVGAHVVIENGIGTGIAGGMIVIAKETATVIGIEDEVRFCYIIHTRLLACSIKHKQSTGMYQPLYPHFCASCSPLRSSLVVTGVPGRHAEPFCAWASLYTLSLIPARLRAI